MASAVTVSRPKSISMEGMIWNANDVLGYALDPGIRGIPKSYFMTCAGICVLHTVQAGFMFSGNVGTGIFMKRNRDGSWSSPVACGLAGIGFGLLIGATLKDAILFLPDEESVQTFFKQGVKLGAQSDITLGVGREFEGGLGASGAGLSSILSIAYTKGIFAGASMEGAYVSPRRNANEAFYGPGNGTPQLIIDGTVLFPNNKMTMMAELGDKLTKLSDGTSEAIGSVEREKAHAAATQADKASETIKSTSSDVIELDAAKGNY